MLDNNMLGPVAEYARRVWELYEVRNGRLYRRDERRPMAVWEGTVSGSLDDRIALTLFRFDTWVIALLDTGLIQEMTERALVDAREEVETWSRNTRGSRRFCTTASASAVAGTR